MSTNLQNPCAILSETPEQTAMEFQSDADVALARSDTVNKGDICRPSMTKKGLAPTSKAQQAEEEKEIHS
jgi:hypothetical protein